MSRHASQLQRVDATARKGRSGAILTGCLHDTLGRRMTPTHATKAGKRYRYYVTAPSPDDTAPVQRVPAAALERQVLDAIRPEAEDRLSAADLATAIRRVDLAPTTIRIAIGMPDGQRLVETAWQAATVRRHREIVRLAGATGPAAPMRSETRATLLTAIARARRWSDELARGTVASTDALATREGCSRRQITATLSLAQLAPDIVEAAIAGRLPHGITQRARRTAR